MKMTQAWFSPPTMGSSHLCLQLQRLLCPLLVFMCMLTHFHVHTHTKHKQTEKNKSSNMNLKCPPPFWYTISAGIFYLNNKVYLVVLTQIKYFHHYSVVLFIFPSPILTTFWSLRISVGSCTPMETSYIRQVFHV